MLEQGLALRPQMPYQAPAQLQRPPAPALTSVTAKLWGWFPSEKLPMTFRSGPLQLTQTMAPTQRPYGSPDRQQVT